MGGESEKLNFSFLLCSEAWLLLRKKRYQEKILERTDNQLENLEKMVCLQMYKLYLCSPLSQTSNSNKSSRENATQSISTSPLTYYQDVPLRFVAHVSNLKGVPLSCPLWPSVKRVTKIHFLSLHSTLHIVKGSTKRHRMIIL